LTAGSAVFVLVVTLLSWGCGDGQPAPGAAAASVAPVAATGIGDSVMLAAENGLREAGVDVHAEVGRQAWEGLLVMEALAREGRLEQTVVVHIGHNGATTEEEFERFVEIAGPDRQLVFLTVRVPREWEAANNALILAGAARHSNVTVLDFRGATEGREDLFWEDGLHLRPEGAEFYAAFVAAGLP
jgi:hypothetical protein